jgi:O-antigen/teichoic acid export membrane protein
MEASGVLLTQAGVQIIGAVTGLMLVRWMPKDEYAWLTICGSLLATLGLLADGGIGTAITAMSGRVAGDRNALAQVADACLSVRNRLSLISLVLTLPPFYIRFTRTQMSPGMAALVVGSAAVMLWPVTSSKFLPVTLRIAGHLKSTQIMELSGALLRCGLTAIVLMVGWRQVYPAFLATVASIGLHAWLARRGVSRVTGMAPGTDVQRAEVWGFVRALYANHIFFCVQGQIATWIISFTSGVTEIADIGALSRLTVFFSIFGAMFHYMVLPNVASTKCPRLVRTKFIVSITGTLGAVLLVIAAACVFPRPFLWILGGSYSHLGAELPLAFAVQGLGVMNGVIWTFMQVRGWVHLSWLNIPLTLAGYVLGVLMAELHSVAGVLIMSGVALLLPTLWALGYAWINLQREIEAMKHDPSKS